MGVHVQLLGSPSLSDSERDLPQPRGHKVWALLAYLLLTEVRPARQVLASLLFPEADDLLRSLRWTVSELRRVLPHLPTLAGDPLRISLPEDTTVDVLVLTTGKWSEAVG